MLETNFVISLELARLLELMGLVVVGPCASTAEARGLLEREPVDLALLDVHVRDGRSTEVAAELVARGVRCIFVTGYSEIPTPDHGVAGRTPAAPNDDRLASGEGADT